MDLPGDHDYEGAVTGQVTLRVRQRGLAAVEFAFIAALLFMVLFGAIEMARLTYVRTLLEEGVRRGARLATVCPLNDGGIAAAAVFTGGGQSGLLPGFSAANIRVEYLNPAGAVIGNPAGAFTTISHVRVSVQNYSMPLLIPFNALTYTPGPVASTQPRESLGVTPTAVTPCPVAG